MDCLHVRAQSAPPPPSCSIGLISLQPLEQNIYSSPHLKNEFHISLETKIQRF